MRLPSFLFLLLFFGSSPAQARERAENSGAFTELNTSGSDECLSESKLLPRVQANLADISIPSDLSVSVHNGEEPGFSIQRDGAELSHRDFERLPSSCEERLALFAVGIALALEHAVAQENLRAEDRAGAQEPNKRPPEPTSSTAPRPAPRAIKAKSARAPRRNKERKKRAASGSTSRSSGVGLRVGLGAGYAWGLGIEHSPLASSQVDLLFSSLAVGLSGLASTETTTREPDGEVRARVYMAGIHGCFEPMRRRFVSPFGCLGAHGGLMTAQGLGFRTDKSGASHLAALSLKAGIDLRLLDHVALRLSASGRANLLRPGYFIQGYSGETNAQAFGGTTQLKLLFLLD